MADEPRYTLPAEVRLALLERDVETLEENQKALKKCMNENFVSKARYYWVEKMFYIVAVTSATTLILALLYTVIVVRKPW